jgi:hypothetical protein
MEFKDIEALCVYYIMGFGIVELIFNIPSHKMSEGMMFTTLSLCVGFVVFNLLVLFIKKLFKDDGPD